jgi:hypothetical protein
MSLGQVIPAHSVTYLCTLARILKWDYEARRGAWNGFAQKFKMTAGY